MNKYLKPIVLFSCAMIIGVLSGCSQNTKQTNNVGQLQEIENTSPTTLEDLPIEKNNEMIWEKDYVEIKPSDLKFGNNWNEEIVLGNTKLTTNALHDISTVDNIFFNDETDYTDLKNMYEVAQEDYRIKTKIFPIGKMSKCDYQMFVSSIPTQEDNQFDVIVHKLTATAFFNENEGGFEELKKNAQESEKLGIGSSFKDVIEELGEPQHKEEIEDNQELLKWITVSYHTDTADLQLVFSYDNTMKKDEAVLSTFSWTANKASSVAHQTIVTSKQ